MCFISIAIDSYINIFQHKPYFFCHEILLLALMTTSFASDDLMMTFNVTYYENSLKFERLLRISCGVRVVKEMD